MGYLMNLRMLSKMRRPSRTARTMVAKLSSSRTMCGRFLGDVGAGDAHGHADVGAFQRRRVVDSVAGHGHELTLRLEGLHDADFVLRGDTRVDTYCTYMLCKYRIRHFRQLGTGQHLTAFIEQAETPSDGARRFRMVAGDHHRHDAGTRAVGNGGGGLGARWIEQAGESKKIKFGLDVSGLNRWRRIETTARKR